MMALNSKTYIGWGEAGPKLSTKGVSRTTNAFTRHQFEDVLATGEPEYGANHGFRLKNGGLVQYEQEKKGLTFLYPKRIVNPDGVSTSPLLICKLQSVTFCNR